MTTLGPGWALIRSKLALSRRLGLLRRKTPLCNWSDIDLTTLIKPGIPADPIGFSAWRREQSPPFLFEDFDPEAAKSFVGVGALRLAEEMLQGQFPYFGYALQLGFPPEWQNNLFGPTRASAHHWSTISEFESADIKLTWETNRFSWVFALARAYFCTDDERYAAAFWTLFESWLRSNSPNSGVNWKCGQEASFRLMALCFGLYAFVHSSSSTPERIAAFLVAIAVHAKRINAYIEYAISQKNNHGISEGVGLLTVGLMFPELKGSEDWKSKGREVIEREAGRQIYADGSYVQHSINYHRVMLQDLAWAIRIGELNDFTLSTSVYERFKKSIRLLHEVTDRDSGYAPNCGANDGALVLPLSDCDYPDMRPVLQSCYFLAEHKRLYAPGPWDEEMVWLNGIESLRAKQAPNQLAVSLDASIGGYYTLHSSNSWIMLRAAHYKDRPSHADQLHLDMWWRGENVLCDPGTYSYNAPAPFDHAFASTRYHNCVVVDDADQMTRLSRFLWADWAIARVKRYGATARQAALEAEHDGYAKYGVKHRRSIACQDSDTWVIIDDLIGAGSHSLRLHWLAQDVAFDLAAPKMLDLKYPAGSIRLLLAATAESQMEVVRAGQRILGEQSGVSDASLGWQSRYYARKDPALSITLECHSELPIRFLTIVMLRDPMEVNLSSIDLSRFQIRSTSFLLSEVGISPVFISST